MSDEVVNQESEEFDVDGYMDNMESGRGNEESGIPLDSQSNVPPDPEFDLNWKGETKKLPLSKIKDYAQQGYDYSQKMAEYNRQMADFEKKQSDFDGRYGRYTELDNYIMENPSWWEKVNADYARAQGQAESAGVDYAETNSEQTEANPQIDALKSQLQELNSFRQSVEQERAQQKQIEDDQKYQEDFKAATEEFGPLGFDFTTPDELGQTLEYKVLKYANEKGINSFKTAFVELEYPNLLKNAQMKAREGLGRDMQQIKKLGITQTHDSRMAGLTQAKNISNRSYEDLVSEALEELGSY